MKVAKEKEEKEKKVRGVGGVRAKARRYLGLSHQRASMPHNICSPETDAKNQQFLAESARAGNHGYKQNTVRRKQAC